jgi:uncharacterized repeat protein (TIGR01451 family)
MAKTTKPRSKKTIMVRLAAAAIVVAGVATAAKLMRPTSNAADAPLAMQAENPSASESASETTAETAVPDESKPAVVSPDQSTASDAAPAPLNPFDTSAVANAFAAKPNNFEEPKSFKPVGDVRPVQYEEPIKDAPAVIAPLDTVPDAAEVAAEGVAPMPKSPFGNGGAAPVAIVADTAPPTGNFGAPGDAAARVEVAPTTQFKTSPGFAAAEPTRNAFDARGLPSTDTGIVGGGTRDSENHAYQPKTEFGSTRASEPYVEPRPLRGVSGTDGRGVPGTKKLEGVQTPSLTIEKIAPSEIQVGKAATFEVVVTNTSQVTAHGVRLIDEVPRGTKLISTTPRAEQSADGDVVWALGDLGPDQQATVKMQLMPTAQGEIGSVATVEFAARASAKTIATKPELELTVSSPAKVMKDDKVIMSIRISNPGTGAASGVVLYNAIPPQLLHSTGRELEYDIGTLEPGKSRELELVLDAVKAGQVLSLLSARCDGPARAEARAEFEVIAPELQVRVDGPSRRYLERQASYTLSVHNPGTAAAKEISLVSYLPEGMKFVKADHLGKYDPEEHSVRWSLEELPPNELGKVSLTAVPIQEGDLKIRVEGTALQGLKAQNEQNVAVEGIAAIKFHVADVEDPVEVGGETTYEIRIVNQGTKAARDVRVVAVVPPQMKALGGTGPTRHTIDGGRVIFEPLARLAPKADTSFTVRVQAIQPGDLRMRIMVLTDGIRQPVTKEESTRVYTDE